MKSKYIVRILLDIFIIITIFSGWWPIALILGIVGACLHRSFIEIIIAGIVYDALFGMVAGMGIYGYIGTCISVIVYTAITYGKGYVFHTT